MKANRLRPSSPKKSMMEQMGTSFAINQTIDKLRQTAAGEMHEAPDIAPLDLNEIAAMIFWEVLPVDGQARTPYAKDVPSWVMDTVDRTLRLQASARARVRFNHTLHSVPKGGFDFPFTPGEKIGFTGEFEYRAGELYFEFGNASGLKAALTIDHVRAIPKYA